MHVTTVSWHPIPFSLCGFAVLRVLVLLLSQSVQRKVLHPQADESQ
ncbi:hypothetical protein T06_5117 [Trichinella sp. T6]|nr:hypothetical protein T06_5117 [Trichinella sp. T6]